MRRIIELSKVVIQNNDRYLLLKRSKDSLVFPGFWDFPGGKIEEGEHPEQAAIRETKEETFLDIPLSKEVQHSNYTNPNTGRTLSIHYFKTSNIKGDVFNKSRTF